jgi:phosphohistidine phosphatase
MQHLILLRHAKSSWDDAGLADHDRPLAGRGLDDAPEMGRRLARRGIAPDLVLTSSARRARMTAELVVAELGQPDCRIEIESAIYLASPGELLAVIAGVDAARRALLVVGHNPGMTQLANMLVPELGLANLPTAGIVAVHCDTDRWAGIDAAGFSLDFCDFPKGFPAARRPQSTSQKQ